MRRFVARVLLALATIAVTTVAAAQPADAHEFDYESGCQNLIPGFCEDLRVRGLLVVHCYRQFYEAPIFQEGKGCGPRQDDGFTSWESFTFEADRGHGYFVSVQPASGAGDGRGYDIIYMVYKDHRNPRAMRWSSVTYNCFPLSGVCAEAERTGGRLPFEQ